tara:strand:+ start:8565 stop:9758 length:1194 start_codon:yes stop_codon:yes gene_type:complete
MKLSTKNMKSLIAILAIGLMSLYSFGQDEGQNMVPNGSFEAVDKNPKKLGSIENATGWVSPTGVRADLFVDSKIADIAVPMNIFGKEDPKEGENYAGIVGFSYGDKQPRTYIMIKLDSPMKKGMRYCVKFNTSLAEASKYACNNLGIFFSKKAYGTDAKLPIIEEASVLHFNNDQKKFNARYNWTEIGGQFIASGGEKFLTIGNFYSNGDTKSERVKKDPRVKIKNIASAYYYIDDVSVILLGEDDICDSAEPEVENDFSSMIYQKVYVTNEKMSSKEKVEIQQVFFGFGKKNLSAQGEVVLNNIVAELKANPESKLQIMGHSTEMEDSVGVENDYYAGMDMKRVGTVMKYLMANGIEESRMIPAAKGNLMKNEGITTADDDELKMAKNRRVTFKLR